MYDQGQNEECIFTCIRSREREVQMFNRQGEVINYQPVTATGGRVPKERTEQIQPVPGCSGNGAA